MAPVVEPWWIEEAKERWNEGGGVREKGRLDAKEAPTGGGTWGRGVKKGWLPTRLNCIVDAPAHRISMRLFLTIAVLLVSKRKASALLAHTYTHAPLFPRLGNFGTDEPPSLSCHGTIIESVIPNRPIGAPMTRQGFHPTFFSPPCDK